MHSPISTLRRLYKISNKYFLVYTIIAGLAIIQASLGIGLAEALRKMINAGVELDVQLLYFALILGIGVVLTQAITNWGFT
ncbi:hypothetical protein [Pseudogracilibacillus sp. SO30301A]|uniref:hypothetical protein n=1 Tax=Pseudogracilibacillus sp. SO30301A TaxID=3098291 RepID=UPI00300E594D